MTWQNATAQRPSFTLEILGSMVRETHISDKNGNVLTTWLRMITTDKDSVERISDRTLRHVVQYSSLIDQNIREKYYPLQANPKDTSKTPLSLGQLREALLNPSPEQVHDQHGQEFILSEFPKLLYGEPVKMFSS
jgi:hypothetical protein